MKRVLSDATKLLVILVAIMLVFGMMLCDVFAEVDGPTGNRDGAEPPAANFTADSWDSLQNAINSASAGDRIRLTDQIINNDNKGRLLIDHKQIIIDLNGKTVDRKRESSSDSGHVFEIQGYSELVIEDSQGGGIITGGWAQNGGAINIHDGSTCTITGGEISGNNATAHGGAVCVRGTLIMTGGTIANNYSGDTGGGIYTDGGGVLNLSNALITHNSSRDSGGGIDHHGDESTISGCTITENWSDNAHGGGIRMSADSEILTIKEETIIDGNTAADNGGGIFLNRGTINMTGGSVSGNTAAYDSGGIKVTDNTTFTATEVTISNNKATAQEGGGIKNLGYTTLKGCTISGNYARLEGGGLFNDHENHGGTLIIENTNNYATSIVNNHSVKNGGGIYSDENLEINGGSITDNQADDRGGGIFIGNDSDSAKIQGSLTVQDNHAKDANSGNDVYLRSGEYLTLNGALDSEAKIGIAMQDITGKAVTEFKTYHPSGDLGEFFLVNEGLNLQMKNNDVYIYSLWDSIQKQIDEASGPKLITLPDHCVASSSDTRLRIKDGRDITIDLNGKKIDRNRTSNSDSGHVFEIEGNSKLTIKDSSASGDDPGKGMITGGYAENGGAINIHEGSTCIIEAGTITGNKADDHGGAICVRGRLEMTGGTITRNHSDDTGGGIYTDGSGELDLKNVKITRNVSTDSGGGIDHHGDESTISACAITDNTSNGAHGGGIRMSADSETLTIEEGTKIDNNTAADNGGGIFLNRGTINMTGGTISGNSADYDGGGIKVTANTEFTANNVTISGNKAVGQEGGGINTLGYTTLTGCIVKENSASKEGGGIHNDDIDTDHARLTITGTTIKDNHTDDNGGGIYSDDELIINGENTITGNSADGFGGGMFIGKGTDYAKIQDKLVVQNNTAKKPGKDVYLRPGEVLTLSGALSDGTKIGIDKDDAEDDFTEDYGKYHNTDGNETNPSTFFTAPKGMSVDFNNNKTEAVIVSGWSSLQGKIDNTQDGKTLKVDKDYTSNSADDPLKLDHRNITIDLDGHTLDRNLGSEQGDGHIFEVQGYSALTIIDSSANGNNPGTGTLTGGYAENGGAINIHDGSTCIIKGGTITGNSADDHGGAICVRGRLEMTGGTITGNYSGDTGGGIYTDGGGELDLENVTIEKNQSEDSGGGIDHHGDESFIKDCKITDNRSIDAHGGGIRMSADGETLTITDTDITKNYADDNGGGIFLNRGEIEMNGGSVSDNNANFDSGGVKVTVNTSFTATEVTIDGNHAYGQEGGGINNIGHTKLIGCTISNNEALLEGGGIHNDDIDGESARLTIEDTTITGNHTDSNGGGIYSDDELIVKGNNTITNNESAGYGGGIFAGKGTDYFKVEGGLVVQNNKAKFGNNTYLRSGEKVTLTGEFNAKTKIGVDLESGSGTLTKDYSENNGPADPRKCFEIKDGYDVVVEGGEVKIKSLWKDLQEEIDNASSDKPIKLTRDYTAADSDDRLQIKEGKTVTIDLDGHTLNRNRNDKDSDGHVFEVFGTLTIKDSSASGVDPGKGRITGGNANNGGGINVNETGTLILESGTIDGNEAENGGGLFVYGTATINGGRITGNEATEINGDGDCGGGAIFLEDSGTLNLYGGEITNNKTAGNGAVYVGPAATVNIHGKPVVRGNGSNDVYLCSTRVLTLDGKLLDGAKISVAKKEKTGVFTSRYKSYNGGDDPTLYFVSGGGYEIALDKNWEAALVLESSGETEYAKPFLDRKDQIKTDPDALTSQNWMSGISGERYINEINNIRAHDASMKVVDLTWNDGTSALGWFFPYKTKKYAKTQIRFIDEQLEDGVRILDLRLNNRYKKIPDGAWWWEWRDDGKNLWMCHGKDGAGGTYQALNHSDDYLSFNEVLTWIKDFLTRHPTETVMINLSAETPYNGHKPFIWERAGKILESVSKEKNPSTNESFLYQEPGADSWNSPYTHLPQLKDCRGKIVVTTSAAYQDLTSGFVIDPGEYTLSNAAGPVLYTGGLNNELNAHEKVHEVQGFYEDLFNKWGHLSLPKDASTNLTQWWQAGLNCTGQNHGWDYMVDNLAPIDFADYVNANLFGTGKVYDPAVMKGNYYGTVSYDAVTRDCNEIVWRSNFFDGLDYCTITVQSDLGDDTKYPEQTFKVLKGTKITLPKNIYKQVSGHYFEGWEKEGFLGMSDTYKAGDSFTVTSDVTFKAQWMNENKTPVSIVWCDGDDADGIRANRINIQVSPDDDPNNVYITNLSSDRNWQTTLTGKAKSIVPVWDGKIVPTEDNPQGQDKPGEYRYEVEKKDGEGWIITLYHTPEQKVSLSGTVTWEDDNDKAGKRPDQVKIRLLADGEKTGEEAIANGAGSWKYSFGEQPQYKDNKKIEYSISVDEIEDYSIGINGFDVVNTYRPDTISLPVAVTWDDNENSKGLRPQSVTVHINGNGKLVETKEITGGDPEWWYIFDDLPLKDEDGNEITYSITADEIEGYTTEIIEQEMGCEVRNKLEVPEDEKEPSSIVDVPVAKELTYAGKALTLVKEGSAEGGTMMYALSETEGTAPDESKFSAELPAGTDPGTYYVWYYVKGNIFHTDTEKEMLSVEIAKRNITVKAVDQTVMLNGTVGEGPEYVSVDSGALASGHTIAEVELEHNDTSIVGESSIKPVSAKITDAEGNDVTGNYRISFTEGKLTVTEPDRESQMGKDGTPLGEGASFEAADKALTGKTGEKDPKGTVYAKLRLKSSKETKTSVKLSWTKLSKAKTYVIYGCKCSKSGKLQKLATVTGKTRTFNKLKKGTYYRFIIVALDKNNDVVSASKLAHAATKGGKVGNHKSVKVKKSILTKAGKLKKGKSLKLRAKPVLKSKKLKAKKHVGLRYESTNTKIATVSSKGVIKGKKKGTCYVYAFAQNGVCKKIKVKVK